MKGKFVTTYLVTRHNGTRLWATIKAKHGELPFTIDRTLDHLDLSILKKGDVVVGTLPVRMIGVHPRFHGHLREGRSRP